MQYKQKRVVVLFSTWLPVVNRQLVNLNVGKFLFY